ncbi:MAG: M48 family metallopeptidase [Chloroflexi bacterium]|nr:M48 family metallopeptidase [Chloroflexota bacterium]
MITIDKIIRSKRRSIALIVEPDGRLIVRAPRRVSQEDIHAFVNEKENWIVKKQAEFKSAYPKFASKEFVEGEGFWYLGRLYPLTFSEQHRPRLFLDGSFILSRTAYPNARAVFERWYREQALQIIPERVEHYAAKYGFTYKQIKITSARTRWGSCSTRGALSFAWRLIMSPLDVVDYVVAHELVHLRAHNHSKGFWGRVAEIMPDYKEKVKWLKINGHLLTLD